MKTSLTLCVLLSAGEVALATPTWASQTSPRSPAPVVLLAKDNQQTTNSPKESKVLTPPPNEENPSPLNAGQNNLPGLNTPSITPAANTQTSAPAPHSGHVPANLDQPVPDEGNLNSQMPETRPLPSSLQPIGPAENLPDNSNQLRGALPTTNPANPELNSGTGKAHSVTNPLQAKINVAAVTAIANKIALPLERIRDPEVAFVEVMLHNGSQQVAVVNGDAAKASIAEHPDAATGGRYLVEVSKPKLTTEKLKILITADVASAGLSEGIGHEYIEPSQYRHRPLGVAIGVDGTRHQVEAERFGVRVLMPGDDTVGWLAFQCDPNEPIKSVTIPLSFSRSLTPDGMLEVPVGAQNGEANLTPTRAQSHQSSSSITRDASSGFMIPPNQPAYPSGDTPLHANSGPSPPGPGYIPAPVSDPIAPPSNSTPPSPGTVK